MRVTARELRVLAYLLDHPDATLHEVGESLKIPPSSVRYYLERFKETGLIEKALCINLEELGIKSYWIGGMVDNAAHPEFFEKSSKHPNVSLVSETTGPHNVVIMILAQNNGALTNTINELKKMGLVVEHFVPVTKYHTHKYKSALFKNMLKT